MPGPRSSVGTSLKRFVPDALKRAIRVAMAPSLPLRARRQLLAVEARLHSPTGYGKRADTEIDLGPGRVFLSGTDLFTDYATLCGVFVNEMFEADYAGRYVIDLGGHCGYFGAYASLKGAACVHSFEPHSGNFQRLMKSVASFQETGCRWQAERCAVGPTDGVVTLNVSSRSWSHSIYTPASGQVIGKELVPMRSFLSVLEQVRVAAAGAPISVKINIEGAAGDVILSIPAEMWREVSEVIFDCEPNGPYEPGPLLAHLAEAGLQRRRARGHLHRAARSGA